MRRLFLAFALLTSLATPSVSHSPVNSSNPADGATLQVVPKTFTLMLPKPGRFMKVDVTHTTADGAANHIIGLKIPSRKLTEMMKFPAPDMGAGIYLVEWRVLGGEGHAIKGTVTYTVSPE